ncbi:MAG: PspC domain-containing protein [Corynebacterium variabile]
MWTTRPVRLPRSQSPNTWFFGVCEGIAVRYQVSPVLVRLVVGLSVTLGSLGLWFYLVALLVMPRYRRPAVAGGGAAEERAGPALHP